MKRTIRLVTLAILCLLNTGSAVAQQRPQTATVPHRSPQAQSQAPAVQVPYQRRDTWYEFLLKQFNPNDVDYGSWLEQRRQEFLDASVRNPYFKYSASTTIAILVLMMVCAKLLIDHRRSMWITAEMMTDIYNHDQYSRKVAREAIKRYNDHSERCNRAIEASELGTSDAASSDVDRLISELQRVTDERNSSQRALELSKHDLKESQLIVAEMSLRLDALQKKSDANRNIGTAVDVRTVDEKLVQHINNLQEQLYAAQNENKRLKGVR